MALTDLEEKSKTTPEKVETEADRFDREVPAGTSDVPTVDTEREDVPLDIETLDRELEVKDEEHEIWLDSVSLSLFLSIWERTRLVFSFTSVLDDELDVDFGPEPWWKSRELSPLLLRCFTRTQGT